MRSGWLLGALSLLVVDVASAQPVVLWRETFDQATKPALPPGWTGAGSGWKTDDRAPSPGSGGLNLTHNVQNAGQVITPVLDLRGAVSAELRYWVRTSQLAKTLTIRASVNGGPFSVSIASGEATIPSEVGTYQERVFALPSDLLGQGQVRLQLETAGSGTLRVDDIELRVTAPLAEVSAEEVDFGFLSLGQLAERELEVRNRGNQPLLLGTPELSGSGFSITPEGAVSLDPGGAQRYVLRFRPSGAGSVSGQVRWTHNGPRSPIVVALRGGGLDTTNTLGFAQDTSSVFEESPLQLGLVLLYADSIPLGAVQVDIRYDPDRLAWEALEPAPGWGAGWQFQARDSTGRVRLLLFDPSGSGLPPGTYRPWILLRWRVRSLPQGVGEHRSTISLEGLLGAQARPDGRTAPLALGMDRHLVRIRARYAEAVATVDSLDLGSVAVGDTARATFAVRNPGGSRTLEIQSVSSTNALFSVEPTRALVAPGEEALFTVRFVPTLRDFGPQRARLRLLHDGLGGTLEIPVSARGTHGRGDGSGDGQVNVVDVTGLIDAVLGRSGIETRLRRALDLYPFPEGDGKLDVRDLVVLVQAILRGRWPDELPLPAVYGPSAPPAVLSSEPVRFLLRTSTEGLSVELESSTPLRGIELHFRLSGAAGLEAVRVDSSLGPGLWIGYRPEAGEYVFLWAALDGQARAPGGYGLGFIDRPGLRTPAVTVRTAIAVDASGQTVPVSWTVGGAVGTESPSERPQRWRIGVPYPNPFTGPELLIPLDVPQSAQVRVWIFDSLGRRVRLLLEGMLHPGRHLVRWDGRSSSGVPVGPGLYGVRLEAGSLRLERAFLVGPRR